MTAPPSAPRPTPLSTLWRSVPAPLLNGLGMAGGLLVCAALTGSLWGLPAAAAAASGYGAVGVADTVSSVRAKPAAMVPAALGSLLVTLVVALTHRHPLLESLCALAVVFLALLWTAYGKRGLPQSFALILSLIFQMAAFQEASLDHGPAVWAHVGAVAGGVVFMALWAQFTGWVLQARYRTLALADSLHNLSRLIRTQAHWTLQQADAHTGTALQRQPAMLSLIQQQAALADVFQSARDLLYADALTDASPRRRRDIEGLVHVVNLRDVVIGCQLDIEQLAGQPGTRNGLLTLGRFLRWHADRVQALSDAVRLGTPCPPAGEPPQLLAPDDDRALQSLARRAQHLHEHHRTLEQALAGQAAGPHPDARALDSLVSPLAWPGAALRRQLHGQSPTVRYALRTTVAMAFAMVVARLLPWNSHPHWLLLTVAVVMRGNLEQTLARRDARVIGTLVGCALASLLLALHPSLPVRFAVLGLTMGLTHAYVAHNYRVTSAASAVMALVLANLFTLGSEPVWWDPAERLADTLIGAGIAWGFSYVLPAWERRQLPALIGRLQAALWSYSRHVLHWHESDAIEPQRAHARREVYDVLWLLAQTLQRTRTEPRYARSGSPALETLLIRSHRLISQLAVVRIVLTQRQRELRRHAGRLAPLLQATEASLHRSLGAATAPRSPPEAPPGVPPLPGASTRPLVSHDLPPPHLDPTPWLERRLVQLQLEATAWAEAATAAKSPPMG